MMYKNDLKDDFWIFEWPKPNSMVQTASDKATHSDVLSIAFWQWTSKNENKCVN